MIVTRWISQFWGVNCWIKKFYILTILMLKPHALIGLTFKNSPKIAVFIQKYTKTWNIRVVIKMANFFLNILDWFKARLSKWRTFLELSKWRIIFYQNDELFRSYQNGELLRYQNRELFLSKWRISFIKMANFVQRFFSKWRIFRFCHWMSH